MPTNVNAQMRPTDYPLDYGNGPARTIRDNPFISAKIRHLREMSAKYDAMRDAKNRRNQEINAAIADSQFREGSMAKAVEKGGFLPGGKITDLSTGAESKGDPNWRAEFVADQADLRQQKEENDAIKIPTVPLEACLNFIGANAGRVFVQADAPTIEGDDDDAFLGGDPRQILDLWQEPVNRSLGKRRAIQRARRTLAEVEPKIIAELKALAKRGEPKFTALMDGGRIDRSGKFQVSHPAARIQMPATRSREHPDFESVVHDHGIAFQVWLNLESVIDKCLTALRARYGESDAKAISEADKPRLLREVEKELLWNRRGEEAAIVLCEKAGLQIQRRCVDPVVILGIEPFGNSRGG